MADKNRPVASKFFSADDHILPRPVETLPAYARSDARQNLAKKLVAAFNLSDVSADVIASAVVDPGAVRKAIGEPEEPQADRINVPGGTLLGIRTTVWARLVTPDPRNPRIGPARRHQFAVDPGTGGDDCTFRPIPDPRSPADRPPTTAELVVDIDSRPHLEWASVQAAKYVLADNDWRQSIASQGVMEAVWLAATRYEHADGSAPAAALTTVEGSSRLTAVHDLLKVNSSAIPYEEQGSKIRSAHKKLNDALASGTPTAEQQVWLRCERVPALILVGFEPHPNGATGFPTAVKSLVALRHVDPPKPWGEGPENESLADEVLSEFARRGLVTPAMRDYLAGSLTKAAARAAHLPDDPAVRAANLAEQLVRLGGLDDRLTDAIRTAVTSQSTRKNVSPKLRSELAAALIVRSVNADKAARDRFRRYLADAFERPVREKPWACTNRPIDELEAEALREVKDFIVSQPSPPDIGPASLELAVRAAYPVVVLKALSGERGTLVNAAAADRRNPGQVLDAMRRKPQGVRQLAQALRDLAAGLKHVRVVDEYGAVQLRDDGTDRPADDEYLRAQFPPPGKAPSAKSGGVTPSDILRDKVSAFEAAVAQLDEASRAVQGVAAGDGSQLVDVDGVDADACVHWRETLNNIVLGLRDWERAYRKRHGTPGPRFPAPIRDADDDGDEENDADE